MTWGVSAQQVNCVGVTAPVVVPNASILTLCNNDSTTAPVLAQAGAGLPNLEYILVDENALIGGEPAILGADLDGVVQPISYSNFPTGHILSIIAVRYDLGKLQSFIESILNHDAAPGLTCCAFVENLQNGICSGINSQGIFNGSDVQDLNNVLDVFKVLTGHNEYSIFTFLNTIDNLNSYASLIPQPCGSGDMPICYALDTTARSQWRYGLSVSTNITTASTVNGNDGAASITPINGIAPFQYLWSNGATTAQINNLSVGTYTVTLTDANGCNGTASVFVGDICTAFEVSESSLGQTCAGLQDAFIGLGPTGGQAPYTVQWFDGQTATLNSGLAMRFNLPNGNYTYSVSDNRGCQFTGNTTITSPDSISAVYHYTNTNQYLYVTADTIQGGTIPYQVDWNFGDSQTWFSGTVTSHAYTTLGNYTVSLRIRDSHGCDTIYTEVINVGSVGTSHIVPTAFSPLYPNPAHEALTLQNAYLQSHWTLSLSNTLGKTLLYTNYEQSPTGTINLHDLPLGLYFYKLNVNEEQLIGAVIIQ